MPADRPLPRFPEPDTQPFWEATARHELRYQVCESCGAVVFYPRSQCPRCLEGKLRWLISQGEGTIYSYSVVRRHTHPFFATQAPYVVAWVDLDEGFRLLSNIVGVDPDAVRIGRRVRVAWEDHALLSLPLFRPA